MPLVDDIAAIRADTTKTEKQKRENVYYVKCKALFGVIQPMRGQVIDHKGFIFRINKAEITREQSLKLNVTFTRPPGGKVRREFVIINPPVLPRQQTGNEKEDLITAINEMLESIAR